MRPRFLTETAAAMLALSLGWLFHLNAGMSIRQVELAFVAFVVRCAIVWSYWTGHNWARIVSVIYSGFCIVRLLQWTHVGMLTRELWMCETALAIFLLCYLPRREVTAWFTRKAPPPPITETQYGDPQSSQGSI